MKIFFITGWPSNDGLSRATVIPHLEELAHDSRITKIWYFSPEPVGAEPPKVPSSKIVHVPMHDPNVRIKAFEKISSHRGRAKAIEDMAFVERPDLVICRGAPSGIFGYRMWRRWRIPFVVESFEPHANYMRSSRAWSRFGLKYLFERRWENKSKSFAAKLITVSQAYKRGLEVSGAVDPSRLMCVPCWVDLQKFRFDAEARQVLRERLAMNDRWVCVYVGKFGGLYYEDAAFDALWWMRQEIGGKFFVLVVSADQHSEIGSQLRKRGFSDRDFSLMSAGHSEVFKYLSAADVAVSFHISTPWSHAYSPIKHGEYWACGLPTLMPQNIGDESEWLEREKAGFVYSVSNRKSVITAVRQLYLLSQERGHRERIRDVALRRRGRHKLTRCYDALISEFGPNSA